MRCWSCRGSVTPCPVDQRLVPLLEVVDAARREGRHRRADEEVVDVRLALGDEPGPLVVVDHRPVAAGEHAPVAAVDHDQLHATQVAGEAEAVAARDGRELLRAQRPVAQELGAVVGLEQGGEHPLLLDLGRAEVAEVLVQPVRGRARRRRARSTSPAAGCPRPTCRRCSSRRSCRGRRRSSRSARPRAPSAPTATPTTPGTARCTPRSRTRARGGGRPARASSRGGRRSAPSPAATSRRRTPGRRAAPAARATPPAAASPSPWRACAARRRRGRERRAPARGTTAARVARRCGTNRTGCAGERARRAGRGAWRSCWAATRATGRASDARRRGRPRTRCAPPARDRRRRRVRSGGRRRGTFGPGDRAPRPCMDRRSRPRSSPCAGSRGAGSVRGAAPSRLVGALAASVRSSPHIGRTVPRASRG